jgi:DDE superfamily endonuclease
MAPPRRRKLRSKESSINLAMSAIDEGHLTSNRAAADHYDVNKDTLRNRRLGKPSREDRIANSKILTELEEKVIIEYALDVDERGFQLNYDLLRGLADKLLADRGARRVGVNWPARFVNRVPELKSRVNRRYDYQRALNEDPRIIKDWFQLVANTKAKYGIIDEDIFNFDEAGFQMGVIGSRVVITGSERRQTPKSIQPGNTEWVTTIVATNSRGWSVPPFIIFKGAQQYDTWHDAVADRPGWVISVSRKGWTSLEHGLLWLKHFDKWTKNLKVGSHRLLIMDGHGSHNTIEFRDYCKDQNIIALCMPPHSSHLLQPLDVGCFRPLKRAYSLEIEGLVRTGINHITKEDFLPAFKAAYDKAIVKDNIVGSFRGAGLVPHDENAVISKLDIRLRTPTPSLPELPQWESQTPRTAAEVVAQSLHVKERIQKHQASSPTSILESLTSLEKGVTLIAHGASVMQIELESLRAANMILSKRKKRKRKVLKGAITLSVAEGLLLKDQQTIARNMASNGASEPRQRRCGRCREPGHRIETCKLPPIDVASPAE